MNSARRYTPLLGYVVIMMLIMVLDGAFRIHIKLLYAVPVGFAAWNHGRRAGWSMASLAVLLLMASALLFGPPDPKLLHAAVSLGAKALIICAEVALILALRRKEVERIYIPPKFVR
jgi:hypothetical protein